MYQSENASKTTTTTYIKFLLVVMHSISFLLPFFLNNQEGFSNPTKWTYLYDNSLLEKTLEKYIDYEKLTPTGERKPNGRLIITTVNV